ncbi:MAG: lipocalin [Gammaproteobacteria bacterium]|nr:lipocalin [Gammaproteobacteria bacterium]
MRSLIILLVTFSISACVSIPESIQPVTDFKLEKYLGKWYEIARLDHSFERGLEQITAEYSMRGDGGVKVINRGFSNEKNDWKNAQGKAYFVGDVDTGHLKVSFFGPFYGSYIIFELDKDYQYAFVSGPDKSYLWLLSRSATVSDEIKQKFIKKSKQIGFDTEQLIFVKQP